MSDVQFWKRHDFRQTLYSEAFGVADYEFDIGCKGQYFYSCCPPVWQLALYISPIFFPFPPPSLPYPPVTSFFTARVTTHENVTAAILSYAVSHLHEGTGKLRKICADTVDHLTESVPSLTVSEK